MLGILIYFINLMGEHLTEQIKEVKKFRISKLINTEDVKRQLNLLIGEDNKIVIGPSDAEVVNGQTEDSESNNKFSLKEESKPTIPIADNNSPISEMDIPPE